MSRQPGLRRERMIKIHESVGRHEKATQIHALSQHGFEAFCVLHCAFIAITSPLMKKCEESQLKWGKEVKTWKHVVHHGNVHR